MRPGPPEIPQTIRDIFAKCDTDQSGFIDFSEIRNALTLYGLDAPDDVCAKVPYGSDARTPRPAPAALSARARLRRDAQVLRVYDATPDGKLDVNEFANLIADLERGQV